MNDTTALLREHQIKVTPQRIAIVDLMHRYGHLSIDDLFEKIKVNFPTISLATLYKNVNAMLDSAFITEVNIPGIKAKYELTKESHAHLICNRCRKVEDLYIDASAFSLRVEQQSHYKLSNTSLQFFGVCASCQ